MPQLELYHYWRSSCSWRLRWALQLKKVPYRSIPINLLTGQQKEASYLKMNPAGTVPTLSVDGVPYGESLAILEWLEDIAPKPALLPSAPPDRLRVRQLSLLIVAGTQPLQNLSAQRYYSSDESARKTYSQYWIRQGLAAYDQIVSKCAGTYSMGGELTMADLCLVPQCYNALRFDIDLAEFPTIERIYHHCMTLKECDEAAPHRQPGAQL